MLRSFHNGRNEKKGDEAMLLIFYSDDYTSNGFGANAPKKGIALIPFNPNKKIFIMFIMRAA